MRRSRRVLMLIAVVVMMGSLGSTRVHAANPPALGVSFWADGDARQCGNTGTDWKTAGSFDDWTRPFLVDSDDHAGGCRLALGINDYDNSLQGLSLLMTWAAQPGSDAGQCGYSGGYFIPITSSFMLSSPAIYINTDGRAGWCNLTFSMSGRSDIELDIQFWTSPGGNAGQCHNELPAGSYYTVREGFPTVTLGLDTDGRVGGCYLKFRLRQL